LEAGSASLRRRLLVRLSDESGIALIMALGIMLVLTIALASTIYVASASQRHANTSNAGQKAYALAESGVNNAIAILHTTYPAPFPGDETVQCVLRQQPIPAGFPGVPIFGAAGTGTVPACPAQPAFQVAPDASRPAETATFWGTLRRISATSITTEYAGNTWVIQSTGSVPNPSGPGASPITRTIRVKVPIDTSAPAPGGTGVLDWVYSGTSTTFPQAVELSSPMYVNGDLTFRNSASVHARLYVTGNLTFENNGDLDGTKCVAGAVPGCLNVGGSVTFQNHNNSSGTAASPLPETHIVGPCTYEAVTTSPLPCGSTPPSPAWTASHIYATVKDNILEPSSFLPLTTSNNAVQCADAANYSCIDYNAWYYNSSPGPGVPCNPAPDALQPAVFDGDSTRNNSVSTSFNLTPSSSYTCRTPNGELSWDPTGGDNNDGLLTIRGTVYIDGSAYVDTPPNKAFSYQGMGAIMLTGSFAMKNSKLCATLTSDGKHCDVTGANTAWDPNPPNGSALVIMADGSGFTSVSTGNPAYVPSPYGFDLTSSEFQGVLAGTNGVNMDTTTQVQGPIMSVNAAVLPSQSLNLTFPPIPFAPSSAPGQPPAPATLLSPREYQGG
jgi:hypothetical protein